MKQLSKEEYINNTVRTLSRMYQVIYEETREPTEQMFKAYLKLASTPLLSVDKRNLTAMIEESRESFKKILKRVHSCYRESDIPMQLRLSFSGARSMLSQKVSDCINADNKMIEYMETAEMSHLNEAAVLLEPMSVSCQATYDCG